MQFVETNKEVPSQIAKAIAIIQPAAFEVHIIGGAAQNNSPILIAGYIEGFRFGCELYF